MTGLLALVLGFLLGTTCPQWKLPWGVEEEPLLPAQSLPGAVVPAVGHDVSVQTPTSKVDASTQTKSEPEQPKLNPKENFPLLNTACAVVRELQERDYAALASYVDKERGLTITPYSTVSEADLNFTPQQVKNFGEDMEKYVWGIQPGSGELIQMTAGDVISQYIFNVDYTQAPRIAVDKINRVGNALENVAEEYPDCRFVEFHFPGLDASLEGLDWCSLKVVLVPSDTRWTLVGLIHSQWTV